MTLSNISSSNFTRTYSLFKRLFFKCSHLREFGTKVLSKKSRISDNQAMNANLYIKTLNEKTMNYRQCEFPFDIIQSMSKNILVISIQWKGVITLFIIS